MQNLRVPPEQALRLLNGKVDEITAMLVKMQVLEYYDFVGWCSKTWRMIDEIYRGDDMHPEDIRIIGTPTCSCGAPLESQQMLLGIYQKRLLDYIGEIEDLVKVSG